MKFRSIQSAFFLSVALLFAGCASSVKLDEPAAGSTTAGSGATAGAGGATAGGAAAGGVKPVDLTAADPVTGGPVNAGRSVYFDYDSFEIKDEFKSVIEGHAKFLRANPSKRAALEGHTDERGGREYNLALGQKRADAVRRALALLGVPEAQSEAVSFGKEKPKATGSDESSFAQNRRVDLAYK